MKLKKIISINLTFVILLALIPFHALGANVERPDLAKELSDDAGTTDNLPTPSDLYWDGISAKWSGMMDTPPDFERYDFELYYSEFDNKETISLVYSTPWYAIDYVNFVKLSQRIVEDNGSGYYYFRVRAVASNSATTAFSDWSELSPAYHYEMPEHLPTPSGLYWEDGIPKFAELGTTIEGIESYTLCLYYAENESIQPQVLVNCNYNVTNGYLLSYPSPFNSLYENKTTGFYYFTVQLISNDITAALDSAVSALSEAYYYEAPVKYPAPVGPYWDGAYMNWNDINPDGGTYEVEVYYGESAETSIDQLQFVSRDSNIFLEDWTSWPGLRQNHVCRFGEGYYFFRVKVRYMESVGIVEGEWSEFSNAYYYDGTEGAQLPSPTNLSWEGQNISWDGLKNPAAKHISYEVKYYFGTREDGTDAHSLPIIDRTYRPGYNGVIEYPFDICASYGLNEGYHFFKVKVLSSNVTIATDSDWSELSPAFELTANDSSNSFNTSFPLPDAPAAETTYHDDGSLTTIVTDKATGSIIETTQYPNGVQAKTTTDAAGNITSDITVPAGVIAEVVIPSKNVTPGTVAVLLLSDGTEKVISTSVPVTDGIAVTLENTATLRLLDNALPYEDVAEDAWYTDAAAFVSARRIMTGTGEDIFEPQATATRAMIWTILSRLNGIDTSSEEPWYSTACNWAMEAGISDGSDANGEITREQLVTMLWRYSGIPQIDADLSNHPDQDKVSSYALDAMRWAVASGIIQGNENGLITPDSTATRAEIAQIIMNFLTMTR